MQGEKGGRRKACRERLEEEGRERKVEGGRQGEKGWMRKVGREMMEVEGRERKDGGGRQGQKGAMTQRKARAGSERQEEEGKHYERKTGRKRRDELCSTH
jgi:hypothetical protein